MTLWLLTISIKKFKAVGFPLESLMTISFGYLMWVNVNSPYLEKEKALNFDVYSVDFIYSEIEISIQIIDMDWNESFFIWMKIKSQV